MDKPDDTIKVLTLDVQRYVVASLMDHGYSVNVKAEVQYRAEYMAYLLSAMMRIPAQVLQDKRVIAEYPKSWWQHVKQRLGWKHETVKVELTEHLLYPTVEVPDKFQDTVRLYIQPSLRGLYD